MISPPARCFAMLMLVSVPTYIIPSFSVAAEPSRTWKKQTPPAHEALPLCPPAIVTQPSLTSRDTTFVSRHIRDDFQSVQVNVDSWGTNIWLDAANEPSIAVDPTNPAHIVVVWRQFDSVSSDFRQAGYAFSHDRGQTWSFPGSIDPGVYRSDPVVVADNVGRFHFYSMHRSGSLYSCQLFTSDDAGVSWSPPIQAYGGDKAWITVDRTGGIGEGNLYAAWDHYGCCGNNWFTRSTTGGASFDSPVPITGDPIWGVISVGPDGTVYVAGRRSISSMEFTVAQSSTAKNPYLPLTFDHAATIYLGGSFVYYPETGPNPAGLLGQVWAATDHSAGPYAGNVYILCSVDPPGDDPLDVCFARSVDGGYAWSEPVKVNDDVANTNSWQWFGTMSVAPNGRIDVAWYDTRNDPGGTISELYYSYSVDAGETWSTNIPVSPPFDPTVGYPIQQKLGDYFDMISDNSGVSIAYAATFNEEQDIYFLRIGPFDCNENGIADDQDIAEHTSNDCNANNTPDECEGAQSDCNANGLIDECELDGNDCNSNGILDVCDIAVATSGDCQQNGVPDECELSGNDCNGNNVPDECEFEGNDCNSNGVFDGCDISLGLSDDCDEDMCPDECQLDGNDCNENYIPDNCELPDHDCDGNGTLDECEIGTHDCNGNSLLDKCDILTGISLDCQPDDIPDECQLADNDCNNSTVPDDCEIAEHDCNNNGILDSCDISGTTSNDCNANALPDDCELIGNDCNANEIPDDCEIAGKDCNGNIVLDECDIASGTSGDCNANGIPDECDINLSLSSDCQPNGIPDECEIQSNDCNSNAIPDDCEIEGRDCNGNGVLDICDLDSQTSADCNENLIPDECDIMSGTSEDCDGNATPDSCELVGNDCNNNGIYDRCELAGNDCDEDKVPDECQLAGRDCNLNTVYDACDIGNGTSVDYNANGIPDECEPFPCQVSSDFRLGPGDSLEQEWFGYSLATCGNRIIVGAPKERTNGLDAGAAYVFHTSEQGWVLEAKLLASDGEDHDYFGMSVAIAGDTAIVGAYGDDDNGSFSGAAYVFTLAGESWAQTQKLTAADGLIGDRFGQSLAMTSDVAAIGAIYNGDLGSRSGSVYVFQEVGGTWIEQDNLHASDGQSYDYFGQSVALVADTVVVGADGEDEKGISAGAAYVFRLQQGSWVQEQKLLAPEGGQADRFGHSVAIATNRIVVGANQDDNPGGAATGSAYVFSYANDVWSFEAEFRPSDAALGDSFGASVAVSLNDIIVGAEQDDDYGADTGSAYRFSLSSESQWIETEKYLPQEGASASHMGCAVARFGTLSVIGAYNDITGVNRTGACYVHGLAGGDCNTNGTLDICDVRAGTSIDCNLNDVPDSCEEFSQGDFNNDGRIDSVDYSFFVDCMNGPNSSPQPSDTRCISTCLCAFDFDTDGDVDLQDSSALQAHLPGPQPQVERESNGVSLNTTQQDQRVNLHEHINNKNAHPKLHTRKLLSLINILGYTQLNFCALACVNFDSEFIRTKSRAKHWKSTGKTTRLSSRPIMSSIEPSVSSYQESTCKRLIAKAAADLSSLADQSHSCMRDQSGLSNEKANHGKTLEDKKTPFLPILAKYRVDMQKQKSYIDTQM